MGDGRSENYSLVVSEIAPRNQTGQEGNCRTNLERIKTFGTIKVIIGFVITVLGPGLFAVSAKRNDESLQVAQKALMR
ncbi:hypothetical protein FACUT_1539 [Fusarium acutatum]|uniref:Uncharacterized protein n=1 Tax=Fusarium acutatum TaxID=78861 RepID=A0A8H4K565_9HYPO|nr:hypothetical protein FACUT_1539 [Fusarium acutatum]